jgi:hypothetical protein
MAHLMFFLISRNLDVNFDHNYFHKGWYVNTDSGWQVSNRYNKMVLIKGYCNEYSLDYLSQSDIIPLCSGNFCKITIHENLEVTVEHNQHRSFPLWHSTQQLSNVIQTENTVWSDRLARIDSTGKIVLGPKNKLVADTEVRTLDQVVDLIIEKQQTQAQKFKKKLNIPLHIFKSGGVDTTFIRALCQDQNINFTEVYEKSQPTDFVKKNQHLLQKFWAYDQLHYWNFPSYIASGANGDECFLRGPAVIAIVTAWHDIDFLSVLEKHPNCYHYHYFNRDYVRAEFKKVYQTKKQIQLTYRNWHALSTRILNILSNDYQHWHLGHTLTWTPMRDFDIARWCLTLPLDQLLDNFLNATITKTCINRLNPALLDTVDTYKNYHA